MDTDPSNRSLKAFEGLPVDELEILNENLEIDPRNFDILVGTICNLNLGDNMVIDTGTSRVIAMLSYLERHNPFGVLLEDGHQVVINTLIAGSADTYHIPFSSLKSWCTPFRIFPSSFGRTTFMGKWVLTERLWRR